MTALEIFFLEGSSSRTGWWRGFEATAFRPASRFPCRQAPDALISAIPAGAMVITTVIITVGIAMVVAVVMTVTSVAVAIIPMVMTVALVVGPGAVAGVERMSRNWRARNQDAREHQHRRAQERADSRLSNDPHVPSPMPFACPRRPGSPSRSGGVAGERLLQPLYFFP